VIYGVELGLVLGAVALAFAFPRLGSPWFEAAERAFVKLAERRGLAVLVVGLAALAARAALLPILPIPVPKGHDEFGYLLAADTFAHGRLTNPPHPLWIHFETFYALWHPTYSTMYPPAQGLIMAFGQAVMGHPFWGVWLSVGLMCAAICWMLQGWLPTTWALLGGMLAIIRLGTLSYWANSYWGGAVAAAGGALVFGALPRIKQSVRILDAFLTALGLAILANSRPYEGLVFSLPVGAALLVWMVGKNRPPFRVALGRLILPAGLFLGIAVALMAYYNWRVTGNPWLMPHHAYWKIYGGNVFLIGQAPRPVPGYQHAELNAFYLDFELAAWKQAHSLGGLLRLEGTKVAQAWDFFLGPVFTLPLLMAMAIVPYGFSWRQISPGTRLMLVAMGLGAAGYAVHLHFQPHYLAPGTCVIYALVLTAMRSVRNWRWRQKPTGLAIARAIPVICVAALAVSAAAYPRALPAQACPLAWDCSDNSMLDRARLLQQLEREPGRHVAIVSYSPEHSPHLEWVHNDADIDNSKVIWARDMGPEQNAELIRYFHGRRIWLVEPDLTPPRLSPYRDK
jgi:hypothetical protein